MAQPGGTDQMPTFAENLEYLFDHRHGPDGTPYSNEEVAAAIRNAGGSVTAAYLSALRRADRDDPRMSYIVWLARFFRVPGGFFLDPAVNERVRAKLDPVPEPRRQTPTGGRPGVLFRDFDAMSPRGKDLLASIIRTVGEWDRSDDSDDGTVTDR